MSAFGLVGKARWYLREADYVRAYLLDARFRGLCKPENSARYVTYFCYAGLANRFRSHFAASIVAREMNRQVVPIWLRTMHLESDGSDIFEDNISVAPGGIPRGYVGLPASSVIDGGFRSLDKGAQKLIVLNLGSQWLPIREVSDALSPASAIEFKFRPELVRQANEFTVSLPRPYLAVHIRQTDFLTNKDNYKPMSYYEAEISAAVQRCESKGRFRTLLVASDDRVSVSPAISSLFENIAVLTPEKGRKQQGVAEEALVHLLSLGRADEFVGTPRSSFSEFADAMIDGTVRVPGLS